MLSIAKMDWDYWNEDDPPVARGGWWICGTGELLN
jgi:hypothetical protein